jgi:hypothetical protein
MKKTYCLVKWKKICRSKGKGGLGIMDLWKMNISLLCKWWWVLKNREGLWQEIVKTKYVRDARYALSLICIMIHLHGLIFSK